MLYSFHAPPGQIYGKKTNNTLIYLPHLLHIDAVAAGVGNTRMRDYGSLPSDGGGWICLLRTACLPVWVLKESLESTGKACRLCKIFYSLCQPPINPILGG